MIQDASSFVFGLLLLTIGAEAMLRGALRIAARLGVSSLVVGLTVVAYGTSAPELAVSVQAALAGQADVSLGNVLGSNIFNVLVILGLSSAVFPLVVNRKLLHGDVWVMLAASVLAGLMALDGRIGRLEGGALLAGLVAYTLTHGLSSRRAAATVPANGAAASDATATPSAVSGASHPAPKRSHPRLLGGAVLCVVGLALLVLGARLLLIGAVAIAKSFGVSELVIGLTIVAAGTSLPELATSVVATVRGERDIAIGNVVGSNIFNLLGVLGASAAIQPTGVLVSPAALRFDVPVMVVVAIACVPIFYTSRRIDRWEGWLLLGGYVGYTAWLIA